MPPPNAEPRKRPRGKPAGEKVRYAARYHALRQRVEIVLRLLGRIKGGTDAASINLELVTVAVEMLSEGE